jgi:hypothetical protein
VQVSAALDVENPTDSDLAYLKAFDDGVYFHQTRVRDQSASIQHYHDLPEALAARPRGHWRVHFHVPLHFKVHGKKVRSTAALLNPDFFQQVLQSTTHLETETYTYTVLPDKYQDATASVSDELRFVSQAVRTAQKAIQR